MRAYTGTTNERWRAAIVAIGAAVLLIPFDAGLAGQGVGKMNYLDAAELELALAWIEVSPHAQVFTIGHSVDYRTDPDRPAIYPIKAVKITGEANQTSTDDSRRNAILFECGMHAREWLATESCYALIQHLVNHATDDTTEVPELLSHVDVWVIPLTNVSGRVIDDTAQGDPEQFHRAVLDAGWRGNGDTRGGCEPGVNVARNFSRSWSNAASTDCTDDPGVADAVSDYRGFAPFSTLEATALRGFVQNHSISMAVVLHSNTTKIWNIWGAADVGGTTIRQLAALAWGLNLEDDRFALSQSAFGTGVGQFSAWLASTSNTAGEPDNGTVRGIQTIFVELPFLDSKPGRAYSTSIYRFGPDDASNGFHPSSNHVRSLIRASFLPMTEELIREARSPGCSLLGGCPTRDFGLVGAKIGRSSLTAGRIESHAAGCLGRLVDGVCESGLVAARDHIVAGDYTAYYRVQNFSSNQANDDVRVTVRVSGTDAAGNVIPAVSATETFLDLDQREARAGSAAVDLSEPGADYTISISLSPRAGSRDDFARNDIKTFKVRTR